MMLRFFVMVCSFLLSSCWVYAQCNDEMVNALQTNLDEHDFAGKFLNNQPLPQGLSDHLRCFTQDLDRKGVIYKNRKISVSLICQDINRINLLYSQVNRMSQELNGLQTNLPNEAEVYSTIRNFNSKSVNSKEQKDNLESIRKIKGLTTFYDYHRYFANYIKEAFELEDRKVESFSIYLEQEQSLDSVYFNFSLRYIPLEISIQQLQNQLLIELTSLQTKLNHYQSKNYSYIKYL